jgi:hypothetical protein
MQDWYYVTSVCQGLILPAQAILCARHVMLASTLHTRGRLVALTALKEPSMLGQGRNRPATAALAVPGSIRP